MDSNEVDLRNTKTCIEFMSERPMHRSLICIKERVWLKGLRHIAT